MNKILKFSNIGVAERMPLLIFMGVILGVISFPVLAGADAGQGMEWGQMTMKLLGGLALFLYGMEQMADALKAVAGERMKVILAKLTTNRFLGAITGAFVTAIIQSSSVTTVLVVGFITAGLMSVSQSVGVIMGANIGTTITAQIVAFKVTKAALLMIAVGFGMLFFSQQEKIKQWGGMLMGLGLVFFGMSVMSDAMKPLRAYQPFLDLMVQMENPLVGILIAAAFTGLIQSSSATTGIVIVMATQGFITLPAGIALAFGANVGTCVTALLASIGKPREAVRAAGVHIMFNIAGVLVWVAFIPQLAEFVAWMSPSTTGLTGTDKLAAEAPRQIANAHTIFNVANTLIFIGFTTQFARIVEKLIPDKPMEEKLIIAPKYLDDVLIETPTLALERVRMEIGHMGERVQEMLDRAMPAFMSGEREQLEEVIAIDDEVDILYDQIVLFLSKVGQQQLTEKQTRDLQHLMAAVNELESMGDVIETDAAALFDTAQEKGVKFSEPTQQVLANLHAKVVETVRHALHAVSHADQRSAQTVIHAKPEINKLVEQADAHLAQRLTTEDPDRLAHYSVEIEMIEKLKRIYYFAKRIARGVVPKTILAKST
ncbi:MAG: Na/Pi cotransporter family protein [Pseudomonadota bacterium]